MTALGHANGPEQRFALWLEVWVKEFALMVELPWASFQDDRPNFAPTLGRRAGSI